MHLYQEPCVNMRSSKLLLMPSFAYDVIYDKRARQNHKQHYEHGIHRNSRKHYLSYIYYANHYILSQYILFFVLSARTGIWNTLRCIFKYNLFFSISAKCKTNEKSHVTAVTMRFLKVARVAVCLNFRFCYCLRKIMMCSAFKTCQMQAQIYRTESLCLENWSNACVFESCQTFKILC